MLRRGMVSNWPAPARVLSPLLARTMLLKCRRAGFFQQIGMIDQIKGQRFTTCGVVNAAGDLDQTTAAIRLAVAVRLRCIAQAVGECAGIVFAQVLVAAQFAHLTKLTGFVTDLGDEGGDAFRADDMAVVDQRGDVSTVCDDAKSWFHCRLTVDIKKPRRVEALNLEILNGQGPWNRTYIPDLEIVVHCQNTRHVLFRSA